MAGQAIFINDITPLIITYNEAPNIARTLGKLGWAKRIVVVDSGSTDGTREIVSNFPRTHLVYRAFDNFAAQCNFGLTQIQTDWVLSLDADYVLSDELVAEIQELTDESHQGFRAHFMYCIQGHRLRGTILPPRTVLYRVAHASYANYGHGHKVAVPGTTGLLNGRIFHDDRKPLSRWLRSQLRYSAQEADYLLSAEQGKLSLSDRIRLLCCIAPWAVPLYVYFLKGCIFDGWFGWRYTLERLLAETIIALELLDRRRQFLGTIPRESRPVADSIAPHPGMSDAD